jgi:hypothetical protein
MTDTTKMTQAAASDGDRALAKAARSLADAHVDENRHALCQPGLEGGSVRGKIHAADIQAHRDCAQEEALTRAARMASETLSASCTMKPAPP